MTTTTDESPTFEQLALQHGLVTEAQLESCRRLVEQLRAKGQERADIRAVLLKKGLVTKPQAQALDKKLQALRQKAAALPQVPGYEVLEKLGQGGMGAVYRARQLSMDREVAIKFVPEEMAHRQDFVERFVQEARAVARLNHENIIAGIDVGSHEDRHYFVMELVRGQPLDKLIAEQGQLSEDQAVPIVRQVALALQHAHEHQFVHRDVKPQNVMITEEGLAKLCDLGLALATGDEAENTRAGQAVGTPYYISPEQARGEAQIDIRSDIYSLGATFYHMLSGRTPFTGESAMVVMTKHLTDTPEPIRKLAPRLSVPVAKVLEKMMARAPADRYQTPAEAALALDKALDLLKRSSRMQAKKRSSASGALRPARATDTGSGVRYAGEHPEGEAGGADRRRRTYAPRRRTSPWMIYGILLGVVLALGGVAYMIMRDGVKIRQGAPPPKEAPEPPGEQPAPPRAAPPPPPEEPPQREESQPPPEEQQEEAHDPSDPSDPSDDEQH